MAVELVLAGAYPQGTILRRRTPARLLDDIAAWWRRNAAEHEPRIEIDADGDPPRLTLALHPAVEPVVFEVPSPGTLSITADTSTGGPGYHRTLVGLVRRMAREQSIAWPKGPLVEGIGDETGFFETGDGGAVDEAMLDWAQDLARAVLEGADKGATGVSIGMASDSTFRQAAFAITSLGPHDRAFFERIAGDRAAGVELFPWWPDRPDGAFYRDRALARLWSDVRWRTPFDETERAVLRAVDRDLERAVASGASGIPWSAWDEVRGLLGRQPAERREASRDASEPDAAPIGYRRGQVGVRFGEWTLDVPGAMAESTSDDGELILYDGSANVRVSTYERSDAAIDETAADAILAYGLMDGRLTAVVDDDGTVGWASERKLDGDETGHHALQGLAAAPGALAFVTISHAPQRADWAAATFRTLRWKPRRSARTGSGASEPAPGPTWTSAERDKVLVRAGLEALLRDPRTRRYVIVEGASWVSSCYVQSILEPGGVIRSELAGARNDPSMGDPERTARAIALGWSAADTAAAGNHVVICQPPVDLAALADLLVTTLREVHALPVGGLRIHVDEAGVAPR